MILAADKEMAIAECFAVLEFGLLWWYDFVFVVDGELMLSVWLIELEAHLYEGSHAVYI